MSKKAYIFLADGFEDIEGLTVVDLLRRAGIDIKTISIKETTRIQTASALSCISGTSSKTSTIRSVDASAIMIITNTKVTMFRDMRI